MTDDLATCGCGTVGEPPRRASGVDPALKRANLNRLRRIEGQVRGLQGMIEGDRYCPDILAQVASAQEALRGVARTLMQNHLRHCAAEAIREGGDAADDMVEELVNLMYRHAR
jgi:DNA-binding FrmR family transcriptional regulator